MDTSDTNNKNILEKVDDINALSDNKVDVEIEPDVKANKIYLHLCSCSIVFNCFTKNSTARNND